GCTVQVLALGGELRLRNAARQTNVECPDSRAGARATFGAHISLARWVVSDQNGRETRRGPGLAAEARRNLGGALAQFGSHRSAVDDRCPPHSELLLHRPPSTLPDGGDQCKKVSPAALVGLSVCRDDGWRGSRRARGLPRFRGRRAC